MALTSRLPEIASALEPAVAAKIAEAAEVVAAKARMLVPKDSTRLMQAIHTDQELEYYHGQQRITTWVVAYSDEAFYGHMVEFGTHHLIGERRHSFGFARGVAQEHPESVAWSTAPRPFMVPALESSRAEGRNLIREGIREACSGSKFAGRTRLKKRI